MKTVNGGHGDACRVLAITDGSGSAYDKNGLAWPELLRLVEAGDAIAQFNPDKLSDGDARVAPVGDQKVKKLVTTCIIVPVRTLFIPCGGRPYTINTQSWKRF